MANQWDMNPQWKTQTAGRSGKSYQQFLAANPTFNPWTNLDTYLGGGRVPGQTGAMENIDDRDQVYAWTDAMTRGMGNVDPYTRNQVFLANVERLRQQYMDKGLDWNQSPFSKLTANDFNYEAGWGLKNGGKSYEDYFATQQQAKTIVKTIKNPDGSMTVTYSDGSTKTTGLDGKTTTTPPTSTSQPTTPQPQQQPAAPGQLSDGQASYLRDDPASALRYGLKRKGFDLDAPGLAASYLRQKYTKPTAALMQFQGLLPGQDPMNANAGVQDTLDMLTSGITGQAGGLTGQLGSIARHIYNNPELATMLQNQVDAQGNPEQARAMDALETLGLLSTFGANDLVANALAGQFQRRRRGYGDLSFEEELGKLRNIPDFLTWYRQDPVLGLYR